MQRSQGRFSLIERMLRVYSVALIFAGIFMWLFQSYRYKDFNIIEMAPILLIIVGVFAMLFSTSGFQSFLKGKTESKYKTRDK